MTLTASGSISVGGTATNASVEQELGASGGFTTPFNQTASFNDTSLRVLAGIPAAGTTISLSSFYGRSSVFYGLAFFGDNAVVTSGGVGQYLSNLVIDSSGYRWVVFLGYNFHGDTYSCNLMKLNADFSIASAWSISPVMGYYPSVPNYILAVDSTNGWVYIVGSSASFQVLNKYTTTGTAVWSKILSISGYTVSNVNHMTLDSSGNLNLSCGAINPSTFISEPHYVKLSSSGTITFQRKLTGPGTGNIQRIITSSAGDNYVVGQNEPNGLLQYCGFLMKYNSAGTLQWQRRIISSTSAYNIASSGYKSIVSDSTYVYVVGDIAEASPKDSYFLACYNFSGVLQWRRAIIASVTGYLNGSYCWNDITLGDDGYLYCCGNNGLVAKYSTAGTLQWLRALTQTGVSSTYFNTLFYIKQVGTILIITGGLGDTQTAYNAFILEVPTDGSRTGSVVAGTFNSTSVTYTWGVSGLAEGTNAATESADVVTDSAGSYATSTGTGSLGTSTSVIVKFSLP